MKVLDKISADFDNSISDEKESIKNIRIDNFTEFKKMGIPTSKEEFWKYTDPSIINGTVPSMLVSKYSFIKILGGNGIIISS